MTIREDLFALLIILALLGGVFLILIFYINLIHPFVEEHQKEKKEKLKKEQDREEQLKKLIFDNINIKNNIFALELELKDLKKKVGKK